MMIPKPVADKIGTSTYAIPAGTVITAYGGYKIVKKQYAVGVTWVITGVGIIKAGVEAKQEKSKSQKVNKK